MLQSRRGFLVGVGSLLTANGVLRRSDQLVMKL